MKKKLLFAVLILVAGSIVFVSAIHLWNGMTVRKNIDAAREEYPGSAEEALIAMLLDSTRSPYVQTHTAIWTLGQIRSEKALPVLQELYMDDPDGITCYGKHDSLLCQYELNKAIKSIENGRLFSHARLRKR